MRFVAAVVLPLAVATWLLTALGLVALRNSPRKRAWLEMNRGWFLWVLLAVYFGVVVTWLAAPIVLAVGAVMYWLSHRDSMPRQSLAGPPQSPPAKAEPERFT